MTNEMMSLACNPVALAGLAEKIVLSHWENNYGGVVKRLNAIELNLVAASAKLAAITGA